MPNLVICQWGFDDEANHLLLQQVASCRIGWVALKLNFWQLPPRENCSRFQDLEPEKLGTAGIVRELHLWYYSRRCLVIEECANPRAVTIFVRGSNKMIIDEAKRAIHDSICVVRNLVRDNRVVYGGGAAEITSSLAVAEEADKHTGIDRYALRASLRCFGCYPHGSSENSGLPPIETLASLKSRQVLEKNPRLGVDCLGGGNNGM